MDRSGGNCEELSPVLAGPSWESLPVFAIVSLSISAIAIVLIGEFVIIGY